ncbi:MAG: acyltransferase family protein [Longimicrobiaceae bacterium]
MRPTLAAEEHDRIPALDGLRGIAVLLVMVYHFSAAWPFSTALVDAAYARASAVGWVGVDLFFVLSGFLITGILYDSRERAGYFTSFYARRFLRIFPLYYAFVLLVLPLCARLIASNPANVLAAFGASREWYLGYAVNFMVALHGWKSTVLQTAHLWSLAVEEQFYLLWPPLVLLLSRRALIRTSAVLVAIALAARVALRLGGGGEVATYVLPFTRMDALLLGALVALAVREMGSVAPLARHAPRVLAASGVVAAATLASAPARMSWASPWVQTIGLTAIAVFFAALLVTAVAAPEASRWGRVLRAPSLRTFGKYSYALYIFHPLVVAVLQANGWGADRFAALGVGAQVGVHLMFTAFATLVSLGVAWLSWHLMEKHFLKLKHRFATRPKAAEPELVPVAGTAAPAL